MNCLRKRFPAASVAVLSWALCENSSFAQSVNDTNLYIANYFMAQQRRWSSLKDNLSSSTVWVILGKIQHKPMTSSYRLKYKIAWTILTQFHYTYALQHSLETHHCMLLPSHPSVHFSWFWWHDEVTFKILNFVHSLQCMGFFIVYYKLHFPSTGFKVK